MDDNEQLQTQIRNLLNLDKDDLERELVGAVSRDEDFLASLNLPMTAPSQPVSYAFASLNFSKRLRLVKEALEDGFEKNRERLYQLVCVKLKYCDQKGAGEVRLLAFILSGLIAQGIILAPFPHLWPLPAVIVYLHKNGFFDRLCKCPKKT